MDHCRIFEENSLLAGCDEMGGLLSILYPNDLVVCPRPRRVGSLSQNFPQPLRCQMSQPNGICKYKVGMELLDVILTEDDSGMGPNHSSSLASSPPFFSGSPPSRADNPLIQDSRFMDGVNPLSQLFFAASPSGLPSPDSSATRGSIKMPLTSKPATVRVEGFDMNSREHPNHRIPAAARVDDFDILIRDRQNPSIPPVIRAEGFNFVNRDDETSSIPAAVRIEGFNILNRGCRNSSISAAA